MTVGKAKAAASKRPYPRTGRTLSFQRFAFLPFPFFRHWSLSQSGLPELLRNYANPTTTVSSAYSLVCVSKFLSSSFSIESACFKVKSGDWLLAK